MKLEFANKGRVKAFLNFYEKRYLIDPLKRNSMSGLLKNLLNGMSVMCRSAYLEPVMVEDEGRIIMIALLAQVDRMPDFLQIAFFDADCKDSRAFKLILDRAYKLAKERGASKITGSLNVHVNYGLGFLASDYNKPQGFGTMHNPEFYHELFSENGFEASDLVSFKKDLDELEELFNPRIIERVNRRYSIRSLDYKHLERDAQIYTSINNEAFKNHPFYYSRKAAEDLELFKDFKPLLRPENLLFAYKGNKPVGFMLWYPDFHEIMKPGETIGLRTVLKNKFMAHRIRTVKIVEMGVLPKEMKNGAVLALLNKVFELVKGKYSLFESGWVLESNTPSKMLGVKLADSISKRYKAYIKDVT
ncbi:MAG: hypothetical protein P4L59_01825 [Desulfosporosinus sp.]|nr:hypothetical protein [Desulfosporosinus sp.]